MSSTQTGRPDSLFSPLLHERARRNGSGPLITYDDRARAERTELSATSFVNWVDKTSNLLVDELDVAAGDRVALPLLADHPGHWVSLVWVAACWQTQTVVIPSADDTARLEIVGPEGAQETSPGPQRVACSLHPLGFGFSTALPDQVIDFAAEVRVQPDAFIATAPPSAADLAWIDDQRRLTQGELVRPEAEAELETGRRTLIVPTEPWPTVAACLLWPLLRDGSAVVAVGASSDQLGDIAAAERVTRP